MDVVLLGLPHKVSAQQGAGDHADGRAHRRPVGRLPPARSGGVREVLRRRAPLPGGAHEGHVRLRSARAESRGDPQGEVRRVARVLRDDDRARRSCRSRRRGCSRGRSRSSGSPGSSGSGIAPSAGTHHPVRANNLRTYKPLEHQHIPEIVQTLAEAGAKDVTLRFVPVSAPLSRGIFATCFAHVDEKVDAGADRRSSTPRRSRASRSCACRRSACRRSSPCKGTNYAEVGVQPGDVADGKRVVACFAATDNLIKGGAGQAIQSMNLMLGLRRAADARGPGGWP